MDSHNCTRMDKCTPRQTRDWHYFCCNAPLELSQPIRRVDCIDCTDSATTHHSEGHPRMIMQSQIGMFMLMLIFGAFMALWPALYIYTQWRARQRESSADIERPNNRAAFELKPVSLPPAIATTPPARRSSISSQYSETALMPQWPDLEVPWQEIQLSPPLPIK